MKDHFLISGPGSRKSITVRRRSKFWIPFWVKDTTKELGPQAKTIQVKIYQIHAFLFEQKIEGRIKRNFSSMNCKSPIG